MFNWNVGDMKLMKQQGNKEYFDNYYIFSEMNSVSREDKISFVDSFTRGKLSYLLKLNEQWECDKNDLKKNKAGEVKTQSFIAWLNQNNKIENTPNYIDIGFHSRSFELVGCRRNFTNLIKPDINDSYDDIVDETFYRQLKLCLHKELCYFEEHDPYEVAKREVKQYNDKYSTSFGIRLIFRSGNKIIVAQDNTSFKGPEITLEQCNILIEKYHKLESTIESFNSEVKEEFIKLEEKS